MINYSEKKTGDPLKIVRHTESECHTQFEGNSKQEEQTVRQIPEQITNFKRCLIDDSQTHNSLMVIYGHGKLQEEQLNYWE